MWFGGMMVLSGALLLAGCEGRGSSAVPATDSTTATAAVADLQGGAVAYAPITGKVHEVKMMGDGTGYRFEPRTIRARPGDGIKFVMHSLPPHNIVFDSTAIAAGQRAQLKANMRSPSDVSSPMLFEENATWELSTGNLKPGKYPFYCSPHLGAGMTGEIVIR